MKAVPHQVICIAHKVFVESFTIDLIFPVFYSFAQPQAFIIRLFTKFDRIVIFTNFKYVLYEP